ncbi:hypothetical protein ACJX0J_006254 [Zea mays]
MWAIVGVTHYTITLIWALMKMMIGIKEIIMIIFIKYIQLSSYIAIHICQLMSAIYSYVQFTYVIECLDLIHICQLMSAIYSYVQYICNFFISKLETTRMLTKYQLQVLTDDVNKYGPLFSSCVRRLNDMAIYFYVNYLIIRSESIKITAPLIAYLFISL